MSEVTFRPATHADLDAYYAELVNRPTARMWAAELDGEIIAMGGLALAKGRWIAVFDIGEKAREALDRNVYVKAAMYREALKGLIRAKQDGIRYIYADADKDAHPRAVEFLERLGFSLDPRSQKLYRWKSS